MIKILPRLPPEPTIHNAPRLSGPSQDLERALVILQLDDEIPHYTAAMVAGSAWSIGSEEIKRQTTNMRRYAKKHLMGDPRQVVIQRDEAWPAAAWQEILYGDTHLMASEIIRSVCALHDKNRKEKKKNIDYWYEGDEQKIIQWDRSNGETPPLPDSHRPPTIELDIQIVDASTKEKVKHHCKWHILPLIIAGMLLLYTVPNPVPEPSLLGDMNLAELSMREYMNLEVITHSRSQKAPPPAAQDERELHWVSGKKIDQYFPPPILMSVNQYSWPKKDLNSLDL